MADFSDDDKTVLKPTSAPTLVPTRRSNEDDESGGTALPVGTRLGEFEIIGLIGIGGFGIVYLAQDHSLQRVVAIKEYMPASLASRSEGMTVSVRSARHVETFQAGLKSFVNEARLLAQFDHPSLVKVYRFWEANGTAYMVMPYYEAQTLKQVLKARGALPDEAWLRELLGHLLDALEILHNEHCYHRDIAPDNVLLLKNDRPLLLDFGAARRVIGDMTQALTVILKPGFAPVEQYAELPHMKQGAWTDLYALAAVVYYSIIGQPPMASVGRMINDGMVPLSQAAADKYSPEFLAAIDQALAIKPEDRPQTVAQFRQLLAVGAPPQSANAAARPVITSATTSKPTAAAAAAVSSNTKTNANGAAGSALPDNRPAKSGSGLVLAGVALAVVLAGGGAWFALKPKTVEKPAEPVAVTPAPTPAPAPTPVTTPAPEPVKPVQIDKPWKPMDALDDVFEGRDRSQTVTALLDQSKVKIGKDKLRFRLTTSKPGYLYVLMVGTDGNSLNLLFPNAIDKNNKISAGKEISLPRPGWAMMAGGPAGTDNFVAIVSESPRDFTEAGLKKVDPFAEFPLDVAAKIAKANVGKPTPFSGKVSCQDGGACSSTYGATSFAIEEVK